jgi:Rps23 Pro-64 3,4-dihydroxylase Tpa1-like proline 4-hydroxylase
MTPKQILDSFSETLMQDDRILSAQERALLRNLLRHARSASLEPETHAVVNATIASAVGETVAQRAFSVLGANIVERIVGSSTDVSTRSAAGWDTISADTPGAPAPQEPPVPPQPGPREIPPSPPQPGPLEIPPSPPQPGQRGSVAQSLGATAAHRARAGRTALLEHPQAAPVQCVVLDEFLAPQELQELTRFTLEHQAEFRVSELVAGNSAEGMINPKHRRSRVLMDLGKHQELILRRIQAALPLVLGRLGIEEFSITKVEAQITASNDGDFFHCHSDNGDPKVASRELTFVYFFHREPRQFSGGELRIHDSPAEGRGYQTIVPQQNQIVFFPCSVQHEITPVGCPSRLCADSRFTLNGWLHK